MTEQELFAELREMIGNPSVNEVSNRQLRLYLNNAAEWLADQLKYVVITDEQAIGLVEDQVEYPLPPDLGWLVWLEWNDIKLSPNTTFGWERDGSAWRTASAANPAEFALQGRHLILNPAASDDAIDTDAFLAMRYIASSQGIGPSGVPQLSEMDQQALLHKAGHRYCSRRTEDAAHVARALNYEKELAQLMKTALGREDNAVEDLTERFTVFTRNRTGGGR